MSVAMALGAAEAGRVDGHERLAVHLVADVDRVAGGAGHLADDHPFGLGQGVHQRALARVAAAHDGHLHHAFFGQLGIEVHGRQLFQHGLQQFVLAAAFLGAGVEHFAAQLIELVGLAFQPGVVGLVGHADHRHLHVAEPLGHLAVQRRQALAGIDDKHDHRGRVDGRLDLFLDVLGQIVDVVDAHAARIDQLDEALAELGKVRDAIAGHAGGRIDDGQPLAGQPIEKARLAHIGPAHDGDLRNTHFFLLLFGSSRSRCGRHFGQALRRKRRRGHFNPGPKYVKSILV